jgi:hypothetical protein
MLLGDDMVGRRGRECAAWELELAKMPVASDDPLAELAPLVAIATIFTTRPLTELLLSCQPLLVPFNSQRARHTTWVDCPTDTRPWQHG